VYVAGEDAVTARPGVRRAPTDRAGRRAASPRRAAAARRCPLGEEIVRCPDRALPERHEGVELCGARPPDPPAVDHL